MRKAFQILAVTLLLIGIQSGWAQGFMNLDFESATVSTPGFVSANNAFPGWTVDAPFILYNSVSLSGGSISIVSTNSGFSYPSLQGKFYVLFAGEDPNSPNATSISISQTGQIPSFAQTVSYWGQTPLPGDSVGVDVTFNGNPLNFAVTASPGGYNIYTASIAAYAGQTGDLSFVVPPNGIGQFDNIQFSASPIPEPGVLSLLGLGGAVLAWRRWKMN